MRMVKKTLAVVVMILSVLMLVVMLAGAVGSWWLRDEVRLTVNSLTEQADHSLQRVQDVVVEADGYVLRSKDAVDKLASQIRSVGASVEQTQKALAAAASTIDAGLSPTMERLGLLAQDVGELLTLLGEALSFGESLPLIGNSGYPAWWTKPPSRSGRWARCWPRHSAPSKAPGRPQRTR